MGKGGREETALVMIVLTTPIDCYADAAASDSLAGGEANVPSDLAIKPWRRKIFATVSVGWAPFPSQ